MSDLTAFGASQATHGSRKNVAGDDEPRLDRRQDVLLALARAVEVGLLRVARVLARARERQRLLAVEVVLAGLQPQRRAAVARPPLMSDTHAVRLDVDPAERVDELGEVAEVDLDDVVDRRCRGTASTVLIIRLGPPIA